MNLHFRTVAKRRDASFNAIQLCSSVCL